MTFTMDGFAGRAGFYSLATPSHSKIVWNIIWLVIARPNAHYYTTKCSGILTIYNHVRSDSMRNIVDSAEPLETLRRKVFFKSRKAS